MPDLRESWPRPRYTVDKMKLTINGQSQEVEADRVDSLLEQLGMAGQAVAVELNKDVVPKKQHATTPLKDGDVLELVTLVGGG